MAKLLQLLAVRAPIPALSLLAVLTFSSLAAAGRDSISSAITCEVRYHFRERLAGSGKEGKRFSAPSYEKEVLPASTPSSDEKQSSLVKGKVPHLPYRFVIKLGGAATSRTLEVDILDKENKSLHGYPQKISDALAEAGAKSQELEIPITPKVTRAIEQNLLAKNQHLTEVQLVVQMAQ